MANNVPLYTASREYARTHDEIPLWRESINENIRCKQAIEDAIRQSFDGLHLKPDCAESVIQVLPSRTLRLRNWSQMRHFT